MWVTCKSKPLLLLALLFAGCTAQSGNTIPASSQPSGSPAAAGEREPFMVHEANLPKGFPRPGPIDLVMIKNYPACRVATVESVDVKGNGQDRLFMPLFDHIQKEKISMTSPVVMDFAAADPAIPKPPIAMSFLYSDEQVGAAGKEGIVTVHDLPAITVLSAGVRGSYDGEHFEKGMKLIAQWLVSHPHTYKVAGTPRFLGYNSPFVPWFLRYGEVQVPVKAVIVTPS